MACQPHAPDDVFHLDLSNNLAAMSLEFLEDPPFGRDQVPERFLEVWF